MRRYKERDDGVEVVTYSLNDKFYAQLIDFLVSLMSISVIILVAFYINDIDLSPGLTFQVTIIIIIVVMMIEVIVNIVSFVCNGDWFCLTQRYMMKMIIEMVIFILFVVIMARNYDHRIRFLNEAVFFGIARSVIYCLYSMQFYKYITNFKVYHDINEYAKEVDNGRGEIFFGDVKPVHNSERL